MSVNSKMTAIADKIRALLGKTGKMGLDAMSTNLGTAQNTVNQQTDLIAQILSDLSTKAGNSPTGTKSITANGTYDVKNYANASVNVPVNTPPSGTKSITTNGTHDVTNYASANVNVPVGVFPSGTKNITSNGTHDVTNYANANVNVPVGVFPSGTKSITTNGTHDVTNYASVTVSVTGSATAQRATGEFTTDNNGEATVSNCGFRPDYVIINGVTGVMFSENEYPTLGIYVQSTDYNYQYTSLTVTQTANGFSVQASKVSGSSEADDSNRPFAYIAMKYT